MGEVALGCILESMRKTILLSEDAREEAGQGWWDC